MRPLLIFTALTLLGITIDAAPRRVSLSRSGTNVTLALPSDVIQRANVRKHLGSGLTTSFVIEIVDVGGRNKARIDIRYDLWDERWLVTTVDVEGKEVDDTLPSLERLSMWWSTLRLPIARVREMPQKAATVRVRMEVLPFSERERRDAEEWVTRTVGLARSGSEAAQRQIQRPGVLDAAIATSIRRRALERFEWSVSYDPSRPDQ